MNGLRNTEARYGLIAIFLHWLMAALIIGLIAIGLYMVSLPDAGHDTTKIRLILYHKELGMLALLLVIIRLAWRLLNPLPELADTLPDWQQMIARFVHLSFYALLLALPLTGWLMSSAAGIPVTVFTTINLPDLIAYSDRLFQRFIAIHQWLAYALTGLIIIHVAAALRHHFWLKDDSLRRMLFTIRR